MKLLVAAVVLALGVAAATSELLSVQPLLPVNPKYSFEEWKEIMKNQAILPERCEGCRNGTISQPALAGRVADEPDTKIIGGAVASAGQFPWQVQVRMDNSYFCGGSVISDRWILSAGHCASGFSTFVIVLGSLYTQSSDPSRVIITSRDGIAHDNYDPLMISDDISVIKLSSKISGWNSKIRPIRLPSSSLARDSLLGQPVVLSGWGRYGTSSVSASISNELRFVNLAVISNSECARTFGSAIRSGNICTAGASRSGRPIGACNGDSGGALVHKNAGTYEQVGVVSFGTSAGCNKKYPSAFTRVTSYLKWISSKTGIAIQ